MRSLAILTTLALLTLVIPTTSAHDECRVGLDGSGVFCSQTFYAGYEECAASLHAPVDTSVHAVCVFTSDHGSNYDMTCVYIIRVAGNSGNSLNSFCPPV